MALALEALGIGKTFGAVAALSTGDLRVREGEIHALLGANGCGKSTLCKVVAGALAPSAGTLRVRGEDVRFASPRDAERAGIALFYQELSLVPRLSVASNILLGREPRRAGFVRRGAGRRRAAELLALFEGVSGPGLVPDAVVGDLSPDQRQIVEILKVFAQEPRLVIMDEATAALDARQSDRLFEILAEKKREGVSTILISHRLDEVFAVADAITVMRNGATIAALETAETSRDEVVRHMVGEVRAPAPRRVAAPAGAPLLRVRGAAAARLRDVSIEARPGEIVGLAGLQGQGQSALLRGLFGADPFTAGTVELGGAPVALLRPADAVRRGIAYVSGDRGRDAALHGRSIFENLAAGILARERPALVRLGLLRPRAAQAAADLGTRHAGLEAPIGSLSGGNQQKVFIARWLATRPRLLLLDDPTKGIDLGAKADLFALVRKLAEEGAAILLHSSEDSELLHHADRILVFNGGSLVAELAGERISALNMTRAAYGEAAA